MPKIPNTSEHRFGLSTEYPTHRVTITTDPYRSGRAVVNVHRSGGVSFLYASPEQLYALAADLTRAASYLRGGQPPRVTEDAKNIERAQKAVEEAKGKLGFAEILLDAAKPQADEAASPPPLTVSVLVPGEYKAYNYNVPEHLEHVERGDFVRLDGGVFDGQIGRVQCVPERRDLVRDFGYAYSISEIV